MKPCLALFDSAGRGVDGTDKDCRAPGLYHGGWCTVNSIGSTFGLWAVRCTSLQVPSNCIGRLE